MAPATEADLCLSDVATPFECVPVARVPPTHALAWVDEHTLLLNTREAWTTCTESGCATWTPRGSDERIFAWNGRVVRLSPDNRPGGLAGLTLYEAGEDAPVGSWDERRQGAGTVFGIDASGKVRAVLRPATPRWEVDRSWQWWKPATWQTWNRQLLALDGNEPDRTALVSVDLATGSTEILFAPERGPVTDVWQDTTDGRPLAVAERWSRSTWHALDPAVADDVAWLETHVDGDFYPLGANANQPVWLLAVWNGQRIAHTMLFDRARHTLARAPPRYGESEGVAWRPLETPEVVARDGLHIPTYFTRPDPERFGPGPYPTVLWVHGGPWGAGSSYGYDGTAQWLADMGLAHLVVDYRGSAGYGRAYTNSDTREMNRDLYAAIETLVADGAVDADRVGWMGHSFGGYAVLVAATTQPDHIRCGASYAGLRRRQFIGGDPADPRLVSRPLFLVHGVDDRRVSVRSARRFADVAVEAGAPVSLLELPGVGHDLGVGSPGWLSSLSSTFFADCLGVPSETPTIPDDVLFDVRHNAAHVRGLPP